MENASWVNLFQRFETKRLIMRRITPSDQEDIFRHYGQDEVTRDLDIESIHTLEETQKFVQFFKRGFEQKRWLRLGIEHKADGILIGTAGYNNWERHRGFYGEIGFDLSPQYWGQGLMVEALQPLIKFGFEEMGLNRIEALFIPEARQAQRVLEKLGFQAEGIRRQYGFWKGRYWDELCYSLLKREWIS